jgi:hypothetical protein
LRRPVPPLVAQGGRIPFHAAVSLMIAVFGELDVLGLANGWFEALVN